MRILVGDLYLNVEDIGSGDPALVFLHYWGGSAQTWRRVIEALQGSYRCIAYDQRGWGASDALRISTNSGTWPMTLPL